MLAPIIHKHLDRIDEIKAEAQIEIDKIVEAIDQKKLIDDPSGAIGEVMDEIAKVLEEKYIPMAAHDGFELKKTLDKYDAQGKEIPIDPSKDPTVNA